MGFQTQVNINQAIGVPGDFASANARTSELNSLGHLVAGTGGVIVGRFAWHSSGKAYNTGTSTPNGFVGREQQALLLNLTDQYGSTVPAGLPVTIFSRGEFLAKNDGSTTSSLGGTVYANSADGKVSASSTNAAASFTASIASNVIASTGSLAPNVGTASISGTTMTVTAISTGAYAVGQTITGTGVTTGTTILAQLTGTAGSTGTYTVSVSQSVTSTTITGSGGCLTVVSMTSGTVSPGQTLTGTGVTSGNTVLANLTGTGGAGKYYVSVADTVSSQAITCSGGTLTVTAVASGSILLNQVIIGGTSGSYVMGTSANANVTGAGGTGTYLVSVGETVSSTTITIAGSVDSGWKWASVTAAGEIGKISTWKR